MGYKISPSEHAGGIAVSLGHGRPCHLKNFTYGLQLLKKKVTFCSNGNLTRKKKKPLSSIFVDLVSNLITCNKIKARILKMERVYVCVSMYVCIYISSKTSIAEKVVIWQKHRNTDF